MIDVVATVLEYRQETKGETASAREVVRPALNVLPTAL